MNQSPCVGGTPVAPAVLVAVTNICQQVSWTPVFLKPALLQYDVFDISRFFIWICAVLLF